MTDFEEFPPSLSFLRTLGILRKGSDQLAGYSFITYTDVETAQRVTAMGTLQFEGQELKLSTAVRKVRGFEFRPAVNVSCSLHVFAARQHFHIFLANDWLLCCLGRANFVILSVIFTCTILSSTFFFPSFSPTFHDTRP